MRVLVACLFILSGLAGCVSDDPTRPTDALRGDAALLADSLILPEGAELEETADGLIAVFEDVERPFSSTFKVPDGATMIRFVADPGAGNTVSVSMSNAETGRRRCNQQPVVDFGSSLVGARSCGSLTAIDPPGTEWTVSSPGSGLIDARIEFLHSPIDGVAAMLDLSQLSHAVYDLNPTRGEYVDSHDGTPLWVEVTLPKGDGPWPTVIAASPYNGQAGRLREGEGESGGTPAMWTYWTQDWAKRGYAAVNVDVRGFGKSGGCVEVWGMNEQLDQKFIVDWVADQQWSDGHVGFYGQSYVGTTPVAAAAHVAENLDAIIAVAPVINAYDDWHYGGVPNGESTGSPAAYQAVVDAGGAFALEENLMRTDLGSILQHATQGVCDADLVVGANDPRAVYNAWYEERDFSLAAADVKAAVMFTEGFEDANVKSAMIPGWFNELQSERLGIFGHWLHQHPARLDIEVLMLGWMDQHVKGRDLGFDRIPDALITVETDLHRTADAWPPTGNTTDLYARFEGGGGSLSAGSGDGSRIVMLNPAANPPDAPLMAQGHPVTLTVTLEDDTPIVAPTLHIAGTLEGENGFVEARLYEDRADGTSRILTWGYVNLALRNGYDSYESLTPGQAFEADLPFRPTEHMADAGSTLRLVIDGVQEGDRGLGVATLAHAAPAALTLEGAGTYLSLPQVPLEAYEPIPLTAVP